MLQITMNLNSFLNKLQQPQMSLPQLQFPNQSDLPSQFDPTSSHYDFLDQILSPIPPSFPWDPSAVDDQSLILSRENDASLQALFNGFAGSVGQISDQTTQRFHHPDQCQNLVPPPTVSGPGGGGAVGEPKQRTRAKRGQATDPHSIAERLRRERIAERMKGLQELVPNANKTDKASMLDEIIDYVKFLQLQVKVLSMSRLGGATSVSQAHLLPDAHAQGRSNIGKQTMPSLNNNNSNDNVRVTENHVTKLLEEDMGSAMQYLQGKGLCLMPISLATAISTAKCHSKNPLASINYTANDALVNGNESCGASSPSMSASTVQSTTTGNFIGPESSRKSE